jgi:hypothetical protein
MAGVHLADKVNRKDIYDFIQKGRVGLLNKEDRIGIVRQRYAENGYEE